MIRILLLTIYFYTPIILFSQIVSIEDKRQSTELGISGFTDFSFNYKKSTNIDWAFSNKSYLQWDIDMWSLLILNQINLDRAGGVDFSNDGYQHIRISRHINNIYTLESFIKNQYDPVRSIDNRKLLGTGVRIKMLDQFIGFSSFYEYERLNTNLISFAWRFNTYFNLDLEINQIASFMFMLYLQPNVMNVSDCRFSNEIKINIKINKQFSYSNVFSAIYDTYPAVNVPEFSYSIKNGLTYKF